jgi:hypothetical protein
LREDLTFLIQEGQPQDWCKVVDTGLPSPFDFCEANARSPLDGLNCRVEAHSVVVLISSKKEN